MERIIVLVTEGKNESVDFAKVATFGNRIAALEFCKANSTGRTKYWKKAEIIEDGERVELCQPDHDEDA